MPLLSRYLIVIPAVLILSVALSKGAGRFGIPGLSVFLFIGLLLGPEGAAVVPFSNVAVAQVLGILALILILHAGGLSTPLDDVRAVRGMALTLSTVGVLIASALVAAFAGRFLHLDWRQGLLLGAAIASTDVAAVFTILRSRSVSLAGRIRPLLELESALNDPTTVFLGIGMLRLMTQPGLSVWMLVPTFFVQMGIGLALGLAGGRIMRWAINHARLEFEGLYPVLSVALVVLLYGITDSLGGSGFLAAYVAGIDLGNRAYVHKRSLIVFHDGVAWLMQILMFLTMGLIARPSDLIAIAPAGFGLAVFLVFIARPVSVLVCLSPFRSGFPERLMVSWAGLRGAVPIVVASYPLIADVPGARTIFNLVFFVVLLSVTLQGTTIPSVARWLGVAAPLHRRVPYPIEYNPTEDTTNELTEIAVQPGARAVGRALVDLALPDQALVVLIRRDDAMIVPRGATVIQPDDRLLVLARAEALPQIRSALQERAAKDHEANAEIDHEARDVDQRRNERRG